MQTKLLGALTILCGTAFGFGQAPSYNGLSGKNAFPQGSGPASNPGNVLTPVSYNAPYPVAPQGYFPSAYPQPIAPPPVLPPSPAIIPYCPQFSDEAEVCDSTKCAKDACHEKC